MIRIAVRFVDELEVNDICRGESDTHNHAGDGSFAIHPLRKDAHDDSGKEGRGGQSESKGNHFGNKPRRMQSKITGYENGDCCGHPSDNQLGFVTHARIDGLFNKVVSHGRRDDEE